MEEGEIISSDEESEPVEVKKEEPAVKKIEQKVNPLNKEKRSFENKENRGDKKKKGTILSIQPIGCQTFHLFIFSSQDLSLAGYHST